MNEIFWVRAESDLAIAIVLRPRGGDWLEDELLRLRSSGVQTLVSMLEDQEILELGLEEEPGLAGRAGLNFISFPICDRSLPADIDCFREFVAGLASRVKSGEHIAIHCRGSIGRASIAAACTLIHVGWTPGDALKAIEAARGCHVPDTQEQENWILRYKA